MNLLFPLTGFFSLYLKSPYFPYLRGSTFNLPPVMAITDVPPPLTHVIGELTKHLHVRPADVRGSKMYNDGMKLHLEDMKSQMVRCLYEKDFCILKLNGGRESCTNRRKDVKTVELWTLQRDNGNTREECCTFPIIMINLQSSPHE